MNNEEETVTVSRDLLNRVIDGRPSAFVELGALLRNTPTKAQLEEDIKHAKFGRDAAVSYRNMIRAMLGLKLGDNMTTAIKRLQRVSEVAKLIASAVDRVEAERGRPVKETYIHPSLGTVEENALTINMRLLNELRKALKELK
jgi:hypothetical protein